MAGKGRCGTGAAPNRRPFRRPRRSTEANRQRVHTLNHVSVVSFVWLCGATSMSEYVLLF